MADIYISISAVVYDKFSQTQAYPKKQQHNNTLTEVFGWHSSTTTETQVPNQVVVFADLKKLVRECVCFTCARNTYWLFCTLTLCLQ